MVKITPILRDLLRNQWLNKKFISPLTNKHLYLLSYIESASLKTNSSLNFPGPKRPWQ